MPVNKNALPVNVLFMQGHVEPIDYDKIMHNLSENFKYLRSCIPKLNQRRVVEDMRKKDIIITTNFLCNLEQGKKANPDLLKLMALANYYKIPFKEIMFTKPADFQSKYY